MKARKALVITPWVGGFVETQVELLRAAGASIEVLVLKHTNGPRMLVLLAALWQAWRYRAKDRPEVVHAYSAWPAGIAGWVLARVHHVPLVVHEHLSPPERLARMPIALKVLESCDRILSPSASHADTISHMVGGKPVTVVPNPVKAVPPRSRADSGLRKTVVCIGRFESQKGFDRIVGASRLMPDVQFHLVGEGSQAAALRKGARDNVEFVGPCNHERALAWMSGADVVACPSRHESFGIVAAEAAALGVPVVATPVGCHESVTKLLVQQDATDAEWAAALRAALLVRVEPMLPDDFRPERFAERILAAWE